VVDAYATVELGEIATASVGRFSATYLWNSAYEDRRLFFLDRSFLSEVNDNRDVGVELAGAIDRFNWWAAAQNGSDGAGEELALSARVSCNVLGESLPSSEGCCALGEAEHLTVGAAWYDDGNLDDGTALYGDVAFAKGRWSAIAEIVDFGDDVQPLPGVNSSTGVVIPVGSGALGAETPWDVMLAFMLVPDRWEIGTRWEDLDDDADTTIWTAALNRYFEGHDAKCTLQFSTADSDASANEADTIAVGLTVGI
jgi:hypothetical protein